MRNAFKIMLIFLATLVFSCVVSHQEFSFRFDVAESIQKELPYAQYVVNENSNSEIIAKDINDESKPLGNGIFTAGINPVKYFGVKNNFCKNLAYNVHLPQKTYGSITPRAP